MSSKPEPPREKHGSTAHARSTPALPEIDARFDEQLYLALNPDVDEAVREGVIESGLAHWREYGRNEELTGHRPTLLHEQHYTALSNSTTSPPTPEEVAAFDSEAYLEANSDVRAAVGKDPRSALNHWLDHGRFEGRIISNRNAYLNRQKSPAKIAARPMGVNFYAPFGAQSGLGSASRGYLAALRAIGIPVHLVNIDLSPWTLPCCVARV